MPATFDSIATTTLGSAASSITFSSIPGTYTDLRVVLVIPSVSGATDVIMQLNSDTGSNYSRTNLTGNGSSTASGQLTNQSSLRLSYGGPSTTLPNMTTVDFFSYSGSTNKTCLITTSDDANGSGFIMRAVGLWRSTSAISTIKLECNLANFNSGTTATLYGILKA